MDVRLTASQPLRDNSSFLDAAFASADLTLVGGVELYEQKSVEDIDWALVVNLVEKGTITGIAGLVAQTAAKKAWTALSTALKSVRSRAVEEQRAANLIVEVSVDQGQFLFILPQDAEDVGVAVKAIPVHVLTGGDPGARLWLGGEWVEAEY